MVDPNTRQGKRTPVTLKIKFKSETLEQFIERYAVDVSQGGIFIRTKEPLAVGTQMKFEFQLRDASPLIAGEGTVVWTRENDPSRPAIAPGMGVRFDRLADGSQGILERILAEKVKQAPQRPTADTTKPPLFTDTPTRVAPAPMQEALLGPDSGRVRRVTGEDGQSDSHTPLPKPMPFHSDADEFPDEAFEEATKVRALDELIAQTAEGGATADELAARRSNGRSDGAEVSDRAETQTEPAEASQQRRDRSHPPAGRATISGSIRSGESYEAPDLPNPPELAARPAKLLDTSPSPRIESGQPGQPAFLPESMVRTRPGVEPARHRPSTPPAMPMPEMPEMRDMRELREKAPSQPPMQPMPPLGMRGFASEQTEPARMPAMKATSRAPMLILALLIVAVAGAAVWFLVIRTRVTEVAAPKPADDSSAVATPGSATPGSAVVPSSENPTGSAAIAVTATAGSGSAAEGSTAPSPEPAYTVISSNAEGARVEIKGTEQAGPAPFTAKLEAGKVYKVRVAARGFAALELDIKGGDDHPMAKLVAKPRVISVVSEPAGALILIDNQATGHTTPFDVELTAAQAARKAVRVQLRKPGYRSADRVVEIARLTEDDSRMVVAIDERLTQQAPPTPRPPVGPVTHPPQGSDGGSASETTPTPGEGSAQTTPPAPGAGSGSASEPEPDFTRRQ